MNEFGLNQRERDLLFRTFRRHPEIDEARIFGSRAKGTGQTNSDIDLVFWGKIDSRLLAQLAGELDELPLPYTFDLNVYDTVRNPNLREHIDRVGKILYRRLATSPAKS
jgi:predicted nucleotidyltransferase